MAKVQISLDDIQRMYLNTLCAYKGEMVYFADINPNLKVLIMDVFSQKLRYVDFSLEDFTALSTGRLGYLNFGDLCCYVARCPVRKYAVGIDSGNFKIEWGDYRYPDASIQVLERLATSFHNSSFYDTYNGIYPTFQDVFERLKNGGKLIAFDRQFALSDEGKVYYRGAYVGQLKKGGSTLDDVKWVDGMGYLVKLAKPGFRVSEK